MLLHVDRARDGSRRLTEIAVLRRPDGARRAAVVTAWHADRGPGIGAADLRALVDGRVRR